MTDQPGYPQNPQPQWQSPPQPGGPQQYAWQQQPQQGFPGGAPQPHKKRNKGLRIGCLSIVGLFVLVIVIGAIASAAGGGNKTAASHSSAPPAAPVATTPAATSATATPAAPAAPQYSVAQQQAIQAAQQYLSMGSGFSREGLIQQLDSSAGEGFSKSLALFAVNHVKVNWDQQAAESAKGYMKMGGFSYSSLVQQLDSSAGEGFTYAQAVYGAKAAGL